MTDVENLGQTRICIEKPLRSEEHIMSALRASSNSEEHYNRLRAAFFTQKLWPNGTTIRIGFYRTSSASNLASFTPIDGMKARREPDGSAAKLDPIEYVIRNMSLENAVRKVVMDRIQPICGLRFVFVNDVSTANVRIGFSSDNGSWSLLGTDCLKSDKKTMNFAWVDASTIMHEFGHVLGMIHEHQNPRGNQIEWNIEALDAWAKQTQGWSKQATYSNIVERYKINQINGSEYDPKSIMLYFYPAKLTINHVGTNINERLSPTDVIYISKTYPGSTLSPEEFFQRSYGESISKKDDKVFFVVVFVGVVVISIAIITLFLHFSGHKTTELKTGRYGRK